jgi:hypothetical protein
VFSLRCELNVDVSCGFFLSTSVTVVVCALPFFNNYKILSMKILAVCQKLMLFANFPQGYLCHDGNILKFGCLFKLK